ncbi:STM3941 family protein [Flavobacterium sp.]|uniref:STM3941 family protein n=1 Tax=Flavobacterium sp. TaxID=239 RepID=UPI0026032985|nr:STM3941 family protein [Flavobacterium sp.]
MKEVYLYKKPFKGIKILALSIPFILIGVWMIYEKPSGSFDNIMGWISTCFFGLGIPIGIFQTFDRRPQIIIDEIGIWDRTSNQEKVKWEQIKRAYPLNIHCQKFVSLVVDDTFKFKKKIHKWSSKLNLLVGAQKFNLQLSQLGVNEKKMTDFVNEIISTEINRRNVLEKYFGK